MPTRRPYPRRRRAPIRRKRYAKRGRPAAGIRPIRQLGNAGIADRALVKMKYQTNTTVTNSPGNSWAAWVFRMNSLYDPEYFVGGHQPLTYDQWGQFYAMYRVYKAKIEFDIVNQESEGAQVGLTFQPNDSTIPLDNSAFERPHTYSRIVGGSGGQNRTKLTRMVYMPSIAGMTPAQYHANEDVAALWNFNPQFVNYGLVFAHSIDNLTVPNLAVNATITFYVELFDRKELSISASNPDIARSSTVKPEQLRAVRDPLTGEMKQAVVSVKT